MACTPIDRTSKRCTARRASERPRPRRAPAHPARGLRNCALAAMDSASCLG
ncbi:hypothetical protein BURPSPAST_D0485 [Burkholderia pseudomallei Pasteur 52237]|uniref:Uncharacterized protein n=1 Tax=Burkholderia mallei (strain NCTC 10229) TaxID=412022 RepID=A2RYU4_BURM9|nr:hypothetical protein BMA10229_1056 [Burkholderia mallei NCTC 10229]EDO90676.1 hypothetical protein BURPSPAST_D0485 [Burkholderia pseudomallei Pasteur 52237]EDP87188.1 hypothetical protein BMA10399_B1880 [Burkholderia mallei ATCC 10399]